LEETKLKMSMVKQNMSNETRMKMQEAKQNMSEETKLKLSKANRGKNNPAWKGGVSFEPYCIQFNNEFKERV